MWNEILNLAISNGIFAVLFLLLLVYELHDSNKREKKYQDTIDKLSSSFSELTILKEHVDDISNDVDDIKQDMSKIVNYISPPKPKRKPKQKGDFPSPLNP